MGALVGQGEVSPPTLLILFEALIQKHGAFCNGNITLRVTGIYL
jgi:hypothetical protein